LLKVITDYYIEKGLVTSRAYLPQQDLSGGHLKVVVIEGRLEGLKGAEGSKLSDRELGMAFPGKTGELVNLREIEQMVDQLNRLPSNQAQMELSRGKNVGGSEVLVKNTPQKPWRAGLSRSNDGQRSTGEQQWGTTFDWDSPLGLADQLMLRGGHDAMTDHQHTSNNAMLNYSVPWGWWNFSYTYSQSEYRSQAQANGFNFKQTGDSQNHQLRAERVIHRDALSKTSLGEVKGKEFDISATGSFVGVSGSVGYGQTTGKTNWVEEQTSITGKSKVDIRTENHTQIDGAVIAADNGNLKLDTGTLGFSDIAGKDKEHGYYLNVGGTYNSGGNGGTVQDGSQVGKGKEGQAGGSVEGWNYEKDREQIVRGTVGAGEIVVRKDAETGADSTAGLNRDVSKAYEITKDDEERTDLYASDSSINAVLHPVVTVQEWTEAFLNYDQTALANFDKAASALNVVVNRVDNILGRPLDAGAEAAAGKDLAESTLEALLLSGKSRKDALTMMGDPAFIDGVLANLARLNGIEPQVIKDIEKTLESDNDTRNPNSVNLETTNVVPPELRPLQKLNLQLSAVQAYIDDHPGSQEAIAYVMAAAQGPKGVAQFIVMQALAGTEIGQTISKNIEKLQSTLSQMVAEAIEERTLDSKEVDDRFLIGGGELITSIMTGAMPGKVLGKGDSRITVEGGTGHGAKATGEAAARIPGRVQSRVNIANGRTETTPLRDNGNPVSAGFDHVLDGHFNREVSNSRSVFTISPDELKGILQSSSVVKSPVVALPDGQFVRTVDVGRAIGTTTLKDGGVSTSVIKVFTDKAGNLITTFPVKVGN